MSRYRIFISSTIDDLEEARAGVDEELWATEIFEAVRVENLPAAEEPSRRVCLEGVASADACVLILSTRYGFVPEENNPENLSVSHLEYREAKRLRKPVFAFIHEGVEPEPRVTGFIREVSDFDEGVLRKRWGSVGYLRLEVRRALLFWLARRAREGGPAGVEQQLVAGLTAYPEIRGIPLLIDTPTAPDQDLQAWLGEVLDGLAAECQRRLLPSPRPPGDFARERHSLALKIRVRPGPHSGWLAVVFSLISTGEPAEQAATVSSPLDLEVAQTAEGARFAAESSIAFVFLAVDDWSRSIDQLLAVAEQQGSMDETRANLLRTAAYISALNQGQRSLEIVRRLLDGRHLASPTVSGGIMALVAAQIRLEHAGAVHALAQAQQLALRLLTSALESGQASSETIYNLARQSLKHSPKAAVAFYAHLLRADPSYDERWYFHRDIGLIHYGSDKYEDAARHYDQACHLKENDSELFRFAGDAYYYQGQWAAALLRYERALEIEVVERYFLDGKVEYASRRIGQGAEQDRRFVRSRRLSHGFSRVAVRLAEAGYRRLAHPIFWLATRICELNFDSHKWLALFANRRGAHDEAINYLSRALWVVPEDPSCRLNLVADLIFRDRGRFDEHARKQARIAIFHGGPQTRGRFRLCLTNTEKREELCDQFEALFQEVERERADWVRRRKEVLRPEAFGRIVHFEFRP